jgi:GNAT superfamily N-acetyltransferase
VSALALRFAQPRERQALEDLQRRASLVYDGYREALLADPAAIHLPLSQLEDRRVRVAERDGEVLGFSAVLPGDVESCDLDGLFVEPSHWKRGIGRALVQDAFAQARRHGLMAMDVVANPYAELFYAGLGFVRVGTEQTAFGIASKMRCKLA